MQNAKQREKSNDRCLKWNHYDCMSLDADKSFGNDKWICPITCKDLGRPQGLTLSQLTSSS